MGKPLTYGIGTFALLAPAVIVPAVATVPYAAVVLGLALAVVALKSLTPIKMPKTLDDVIKYVVGAGALLVGVSITGLITLVADQATMGAVLSGVGVVAGLATTVFGIKK
ncbi:MAG: hypothetical protein ACE5DI_01300 [Candidatus Micrarchaeia archaeon]